MKKFDINDYIKKNMIIINKSILINYYGVSEQSSKRIIGEMKKKGLIMKINRGNYIFISNLNKIDNYTMAMMLDNESYISLYNVLERNVIKQAHVKTFVISNREITKNKELLDKYRIEFKYSKIPMTFGIEIINKIRYANTERALLDLIYFHTYKQYPITSELYLEGNIDESKIEEYLQYYPIRVSNFYYNKLQEYAK